MNIIYKLSKSLLTICLLFMVSSCESVLDQQPFSQLSDEQFWKTNADANAAVSGIYDAMQKHYRVRTFTQGEFRSDSYTKSPQATGTFLEFIDNSLTPANDISDWSLLYQAIGRANLCIDRIPRINGFNRSLLAEARALRSYLYFDAIRNFGDVPLFTEPITSPSQELSRPRTDLNRIMNEVVVPDMLEAEANLTGEKVAFRFSKASLFAHQATVYMYLRQYANAKAAITKLLSLNQHSLVSTRDAWQKMFLNDPNLGGKFMTGSELILSLQYSLTEDADRSGVFSVLFAGIPQVVISPRLTNKWLDAYPLDSNLFKAKFPGFTPLSTTPTGEKLWGDWRYLDSRELTGTQVNGTRVAKYNKSNYTNAIDNSDIHLFRLADMILLLAEAENKLGNTAAAITNLNLIRTARQLPTVATNITFTELELEDLILDERQFELLGEGRRWWDLVRTKKAIKVMGPINGQTEPTILLPIFQRHLIENKLLTQNEGYN